MTKKIKKGLNLIGVISVVIIMILGILLVDNKIININNIQEFKQAMTTANTNFKKVSAGFYHSLAIDTENHLWVWGTNTEGQLGDGTTTKVTSPKMIMSDKTFIDIAGGKSHSLAIDSDGKIWTWGKNMSGELGINGLDKSLVPVQIEHPSTFTSVSAGEFCSAAIDDNGDLWTWGLNDVGQLGDGTDTDRSTPVKIELQTGVKFRKVSIMSYHTMAIDEEYNLWTWGDNAYGQLGNLSYTPSMRPIHVMEDLTFIDVAAGMNHSMAIDQNGGLWTWGENNYGQLGNETFTKSITPIQIMFNLRFEKITTGGNHCIAIDTDRNLWTWGLNDKSQLGNESTTNSSRPVLLKEGTAFEEIAAGSNHTICLDERQNLWVFGNNQNGILGIGNTYYTTKNTPTQVKSGMNFKKIFTSNSNHTLALDNDNHLWAWGNNTYGQFGNGNTNSSSIPIPIQVGKKFKDAAVMSSISSTSNRVIKNSNTTVYTYYRRYYYSSYAIDMRGNLYTWGGYRIYTTETTEVSRYNSSTKTTEITTSNKTLEDTAYIMEQEQILVGTTFKKVSANNMGAYAIDTNGNLWNVYLFNSTKEQLTTDTVFEDIFVGSSHCFAIDSENNLWAWGNNASGQFGDDTVTNSTVPVKVDISINFKQIGAGNNISYGIDENDNLYVWGDITNKLNGNKSSVTSAPLKVEEDLEFKTVSAKGSSLIAITTDGKIYTWGYNGNGQLGNGTNSNVISLTELKFERPIEQVSAGENTSYLLDNEGSLWSSGSYTGMEFSTREFSKVIVSDEFTVTFVDPETGREDIQQVANGDCAVPPSWKKEGYVIKWDNDFSRVTSNMTVTATWELCKYTISYNLNGGSYGAERPTAGTYGVTLNISNPTRTGYTFTGWTSTVTDGLNTATALMGTSATTAVQLWNGTETTNEYFANLTIKDKANVKLTANWVPNVYKITLDNRGATVPGTEEIYLTYGQKFSLTRNGEMITVIEPPTAEEGYIFGGYYESTADFNNEQKTYYINPQGRITASNTKWANDVTLYAKWVENREATYRVEHYKQNRALNAYQFVEANTPDPTGIVGIEVTARPKSYTGFVENTSHPDRVASGFIQADGSLVLKLYYDVILCNVTFKDNNETIGETEVVEYGKPAHPPILEKQGYTLAWDKSYSYITQDTILNTNWVPNRNTKYRVEHYKQTKNGTYSLSDTVQCTGTTATSVAAEAKEYLGYTENINHNERIPSGTVAPDGSLVLKLYYDITEYTVTFKDGENVLKEEKVGHGMPATAPFVEKQGFVLEWIGDFSSVTSNMVINAKWIPERYTQYTVEHYKQTKSGNYILEDSVSLQGVTSSTVRAYPKTYLGYTENIKHSERIVSGIVASDGSLVLKLYYDITEYTVIFRDGDNVVDEQTVGHGMSATAPAIEKEGYILKWLESFYSVKSDLVVNAEWIPRESVPYRVEHYKYIPEKSQYEIADIENLLGTSGSTVYASAKTYTGYEENTTYEGRIASGVVEGDGSLALKLYYKVKELTVMFKDGDEIIKQETVRYGESATLPDPAPVKQGYTLRWIGNYSIIREDIIINAEWIPNRNTQYKVIHYKESLDGEYVPHFTQTFYGTTDTQVTAEAIEIAGCNENTNHINRTVTGTIASDGSLKLKLYYDLNEYVVTFKDEESNFEQSQVVKYGGNATAPNLTKTGYRLYWSAPYTNVIKDLTAEAMWLTGDNAVCRTEYYIQDKDTGEYELDDYKNEIKKINSIVVAEPKLYLDYTEDLVHPDRITRGTVTEDGQLVLRLYYHANDFTVKFMSEGRKVKTETVNYGESATPPNLTKPGYVLRWDTPYDNVTKNLTVTAQWIEGENTTYRVIHYLQNVDMNGYTQTEVEKLDGTTEQIATAVYKEYEGFTPDIENELTNYSDVITGDGNLVLKLYYNRNVYSINYVLNGGIETESLPKEYTYGVETALLKDGVIKEGYRLVGWYDNSEFTGEKITVISATDTGNKVLYAKWVDKDSTDPDDPDDPNNPDDPNDPNNDKDYYITSQVYNVNKVESIISKVSPETKVSEYMNNINTNGTLENVVNSKNTQLTSTDLISTGSILNVKYKQKIYRYTNIVTGDVTGDGKINIKDLVKLNQAVLGKATLEGVYNTAGDVTGDSKINIKDLVKLNQAILGKTSL